MTKVPIYTQSGSIAGLVGLSRDITQLKQTEQALRQAEEKYRAIYENSPEEFMKRSAERRLRGLDSLDRRDRVTEALGAYRNAFGRYPATLKDLVQAGFKAIYIRNRVIFGPIRINFFPASSHQNALI